MRIRVGKRKSKMWNKGDACLSNPLTNKFRSKIKLENTTWNQKEDESIIEPKLDEYFREIGYRKDTEYDKLIKHTSNEKIYKTIMYLEKDIIKRSFNDGKQLYIEYILKIITNKEIDEETMICFLTLLRIFISKANTDIPNILADIMKVLSVIFKNYHTKINQWTFLEHYCMH
ncbi:hypothetical protein HZS_1370 [Henneguya salminicola]|nr:hypothetical protein HZS_1370 [Henneguya salminicola]